MHPVFIHALWRSGSTYVWSKLRTNGSCCCYYEPLHEEISRLSADTVTLPPHPELSRAMRHPAQTTNYFAEYADLIRSDVLRFSPALSYDRFLLLPEQTDEELRLYLSQLIGSASAARRTAVLCFCRSQMRSAWMKHTFGGSHVAQIRNPFDQWSSFKVEPYFCNKMLILALKLRNLHRRSFAHIPAFERFAQNMSTRPALPVHQFFNFFLSEKDTLAVFLIIWIASALQAVSHADFVLDIDLLSADRDYRAAASDWFGGVGCPADFSDCASPQASHPPVPLGEFEQMLGDAVAAIRTGASSLVVTRREAIMSRLASLSPMSHRALRGALGE